MIGHRAAASTSWAHRMTTIAAKTFRQLIIGRDKWRANVSARLSILVGRSLLPSSGLAGQAAWCRIL